jgi:hypothetical protein
VKPGDLVVLRSGGPVVVLGELGAAQPGGAFTHGEIMWFAFNGVLQRAMVRLAVLRPATDDEARAVLGAPRAGANA